MPLCLNGLFKALTYAILAINPITFTINLGAHFYKSQRCILFKRPWQILLLRQARSNFIPPAAPATDPVR
jgi:hypothetical protein